MPSQNTRLVAVVALFTALVWLSYYDVENRVEFGVGVVVGGIAVVLTAAVLSLLEW
jgi:hypothetical protein